MVTSFFYHLGKPQAQSQGWIAVDLAAEAGKVILGGGHGVFPGKRNGSRQRTRWGRHKTDRAVSALFVRKGSLLRD